MIWINVVWVIWVIVGVIRIDMIQNYRIFAPNFFNFKIILALSIFGNVLLPRFSVSFFDAPCHNVLLPKKYEVSLLKSLGLPIFLSGILSLLLRPTQLFHLIPIPLSRLVSCGIMLPVVIYGFIGMALFVFCPKSIYILSSLLLSPKENSQSLYPRLSMEVIAWLVWMSASSERAQLVTSYSEPIVIANNKTCSILVQLVFADWSVINF